MSDYIEIRERVEASLRESSPVRTDREIKVLTDLEALLRSDEIARWKVYPREGEGV